MSEGKQKEATEKASDREWVEAEEPRAWLQRYVIDGRDVCCIDLPYGASTAMFSDEERAWTAARRMIEDEA